MKLARAHFAVTLVAQGGLRSVPLHVPMLLTARIGSSRICFAYDAEQRTLIGTHVRCSQPQQQEPLQPLNLQAGSPTLHRDKNARVTECPADAPQKHQQVSQFLRGAGLASLFRDLGRVAEKQPAASPPKVNASKHACFGESWDTGLSHGAPETVSSGVKSLPLASVKLPHVSPPTGVLWCTHVRASDASSTLRNVQKWDESVGVLSVAADGYLLAWEYSIAYSSAQFGDINESGSGAEPHMRCLRPNDPDREERHSTQPCCTDKRHAAGSSEYPEPDWAHRDNTASISTSKPLLGHSESVVEPLDGSSINGGLPGEFTGKHAVEAATCFVKEKAPAYDDLGQERA